MKMAFGQTLIGGTILKLGIAEAVIRPKVSGIEIQI